MVMNFTVEYSVRQNCFHIDTIERTLETNIRTSINQIDVDYRIIGIFSSYEEATKYVREFRAKITKMDNI